MNEVIVMFTLPFALMLMGWGLHLWMKWIDGD